MMIENVIKNGYCLGCGGCQVLNEVTTIEDEFGKYLPNTDNYQDLDQDSCPMLGETENELQISKRLFANQKNINFEPYIGYFKSIYAGHVLINQFRENGTSGGMTKWFLCKLMQKKLVDGVIHVVRKKSDNKLFDYAISETIAEVREASESAYYTTNFSEVISKILREKNDKKYVFVGVPCYCKSINLLRQKFPELSRKIKIIVGIFCGHMKTKNYAKLMAWESKLNPHEIEYVNFRKKQSDDKDATDYNFHAKTYKFEKITKRKLLSGGDYNIPHLKYKACDYCEDVFGYCADIVFGDAWLEEFRKNNKGSNVVVIRNQEMLDIFMQFKEEIFIKKLSVTELIQSQSSSFSHRVQNLCYRLYLNEKNNEWYPKKMISPKLISNNRNRKIQDLRILIREKSHYAFHEALSKNDLDLYFKKINIYVENLNSQYRVSKINIFFIILKKKLRSLIKFFSNVFNLSY